MKIYKFYIDTGFANANHRWEMTEAEVREMFLLDEDAEIPEDDLSAYIREELHNYIDYGWYTEDEDK